MKILRCVVGKVRAIHPLEPDPRKLDLTYNAYWNIKAYGVSLSLQAKEPRVEPHIQEFRAHLQLL